MMTENEFIGKLSMFSEKITKEFGDRKGNFSDLERFGILKVAELCITASRGIEAMNKLKKCSISKEEES